MIVLNSHIVLLPTHDFIFVGGRGFQGYGFAYCHMDALVELVKCMNVASRRRAKVSWEAADKNTPAT